MAKQLGNIEIRQLTDKELIEVYREQREHLVRLRLAHHVNPLDNPMEIRHTRRYIARLLTEINRRKKNALNKKMHNR